MEYCRSRNPLLAFLALSCLLLLLLQPVSSVPTSRSLHLQNQQRSPSLKLSSQEMTAMSATAAAGNLGRAAARMDVEVNDYPGSGANNRHDPPKGPGRA